VRIVSLVPSATEILFRLGAGDEVVGVTYACDFPPEAREKPVVVYPRYDTTRLPPREIDRLISEAYKKGEDLYIVDRRLLSELKPDLILAQGLCDVCAATPDSVEGAIRSLSPQPRVLTLHPHSVEEILADILKVGEAVGRGREANELVAQSREEIDCVAERVKGLHVKRTFFMEWPDPPFCSGHWVPEMIEIAGGVDFGLKSSPSRRVEPEEIVRFSPDIIICGPCGFGLEEARLAAEKLAEQYWVGETPASQNGEIYAVDASIYFSRHGPSAVKGITILGEIIHGDIFRGVAPRDSFSKIGRMF